MDLIVERCAGLGVHRDTVVATVGVPARSGRGRHRETVTFRAMTAGLEQLAGWLAGFDVTLVGMEATGVYWRPVFRVLEPRFTCWLLILPARATTTEADPEAFRRRVRHAIKDLEAERVSRQPMKEAAMHRRHRHGPHVTAAP